MKYASFLAAAVLVACSKKTDATGAPTASSTSLATASASAPAARVALDVAKVRDYKLSLKPSDSFEARIAAVSERLGPPTRKENGRATWAAADAAQCSAFWISEDGSGSSPSNVAAKDFGEQWGRACLLLAGVSPPRKPFTDPVVTPSTFGKKGSWQQVRVEGLLGNVRWQSTASRYSFTLVDAKVPTATSDCTMEMGAAPPKAAPNTPIVVECGTGGSSSTGTYLSECFVVDK